MAQRSPVRKLITGRSKKPSSSCVVLHGLGYGVDVARERSVALDALILLTRMECHLRMWLMVSRRQY